MRHLIILALLAAGPFVGAQEPVAEQAPPNRNLQIAYDHFSKKEYPLAAAYYSKVLSATPGDGDALLGLAWSQFYIGKTWEARSLFERVIALYPGNASALEGLKYAPKIYSASIGYSYAWLTYTHNASKSGGYSISVPVSLTYKQLWTIGMGYTYSLIRFIPSTNNAKQTEYNPSFSYNVNKNVTLLSAYDYISVNDPITDAGKVYTLGFTAHDYDPNTTFFVSAGGYGSYSTYRALRVTQATPHLGLGYGKFSTDIFAMYTNIDSTNENLRSIGASLAAGPFNNFTATIKGYTGDKRIPVEEWGTLIFNNRDLYRRGWKFSIAWTHNDITAFSSYAIDNAESTAATLLGPINTAYTSRTAVAGLTYRL